MTPLFSALFFTNSAVLTHAQAGKGTNKPLPPIATTLWNRPVGYLVIIFGSDLAVTPVIPRMVVQVFVYLTAGYPDLMRVMRVVADNAPLITFVIAFMITFMTRR